jgi:ABC-type transport system involved in multi-copper enzyme maturation permease subunit
MFPGPVFNLELRRLSRRRRYYALLTLYGLLLLYMVWDNNPQAMFDAPGGAQRGLSLDQRHYAGKSLFQAYAIWQTAMVVLLTPAMTAGVIAEERERKTMPCLLVSGLTSREIVVGKLCARLFHLACFVALGLPILVLVEHFGGVGPKGVLIYFASTATTAFFLGAVSSFVSTQARRTRDAVVTVYFLDFAWHVGPLIVLLFLSNEEGPLALLPNAAKCVAWTSPILVMFDNVRGTRFWESPNLSNSVRMIALQATLGAVLLGFAVRRLRPAFLRAESEEQSVRANERDEAKSKNKGSQSAPSPPDPRPDRSWLHETSPDDDSAPAEPAPPEPSRIESRPRPFRRRPACGDDAMLWKEVWTAPSSTTMRVLGGLVLATILLLAVVFCLSKGFASAEELLAKGYSAEYEDLYHRLDLNVALRYVVTITAGFMLLWVSVVAACSLAGERNNDTWASLLSTPLSGFEIMRGKVIGAFWSVRWLVVIWLALVLMGLIVGAVHPLGVLGVTLATATYLAFGCVLGMAYSLRARSSSRALVATLITLIILNGAYLIVFAPTQMRSALVLMGVTPFVEQSALLSYLDAKWLFDFQSPDMDMLKIALTCLISVALYGGGAFVLVLWTLNSFDRAIGRPSSKTVAVRRPSKVKQP